MTAFDMYSRQIILGEIDFTEIDAAVRLIHTLVRRASNDICREALEEWNKSHDSF
jgi:hypothetical protein